ncbi:hypothetical protein [Paenarthrobacter sp. NCHU4564]|uniref:hypothetical protein n=1 Tax=Paenarthrobacter sp. NCHU4564 TaxID=3451353 RepID=UPI003F981892
MISTRAEESTVRVSSDSKEHVSFSVDASSPVTVRVELNGGCPCGAEHRHTGSYVDSDLGR